MIIFDTAYTYRMLVERKQMTNIVSRDIEGFFTHVWTVHPVSTLVLAEDDPARFGGTRVHSVSDRHTFIEASFGRFAFLRHFPKLNLLISQALLGMRLLWIVLRHRVSIIRAEDPLYSGAFAWLLARLTGRPVIMGVWGNPGVARASTGTPLAPRLFPTVAAEEKFEKRFLAKADLVIVQNEDNRRFVLSTGVAPEKTAIFRLGNLLHEAHFVEPAERSDGRGSLADLGIAPCEPVLVCISRLEPLKMTETLLQVVKRLKDRGLFAKGLMVGDGTLRAALEAQAAELGIADRIVFAGYQDQVWLSEILPHTTAIIAPLSGRSLGEAALSGTPVIAYDVDWHGELIATGTTGELVPLNDVEGMADAAARILADPSYGRRIGRAARQWMVDRMRPAVVNDEQRLAYDRVLKRRQHWLKRTR